jgi:hypothetical protein
MLLSLLSFDWYDTFLDGDVLLKSMLWQGQFFVSKFVRLYSGSVVPSTGAYLTEIGEIMSWASTNINNPNKNFHCLGEAPVPLTHSRGTSTSQYYQVVPGTSTPGTLATRLVQDSSS